MIRLTNGIIAINNNGEIINFKDRVEYDAFLKTKEIDECDLLFATPKDLYNSIVRSGEEIAELEKRLNHKL